MRMSKFMWISADPDAELRYTSKNQYLSLILYYIDISKLQFIILSLIRLLMIFEIFSAKKPSGRPALRETSSRLNRPLPASSLLRPLPELNEDETTLQLESSKRPTGK